MSRFRLDILPFLVAAIALIAACTVTPVSELPPTATVGEPAMTPTAVVQTGGVLISELLPGVPGNNNLEFVELYNAGPDVVDLKGWSLWYRMADDQEERRLTIWGKPTQLPRYGHLLLAREGEDVGAVADGTFDVPIFERRGGLQLRDAEGEVVDTLGWGDAPVSFVRDVPAPAPEAGASLERLPGGVAGNAQDTDDGTADFQSRKEPLPQNSGAPTTPEPADALVIEALLPASVAPGGAMPVTVVVENRVGRDLGALQVAVPLPEGITVLSEVRGEGVGTAAPEAANEGAVVYTVAALAADASHRAEFTVQSPWRYGAVHLRGYHVSAQDGSAVDYGPFATVLVEGGAIPVGTARTLVGEVVTIEGIATMYTGGFYAGTTGTKFYLEDETGGVQVYCPGAKGVISVHIGDQVRVTGKIEVYRDSVEIVPVVVPDDVEVLASEAVWLEPTGVSVHDATHDEAIPGRLIEVEGTIARLEEFSYSYEADILDDAGNTILAYIDKESNFSPEFIDAGDRYRVAGISELYDGQWQIKPRVAEDFSRIYPPELMIEAAAPISVEPGGLVTYTLTATNHTSARLTDLTIRAEVPVSQVEIITISDGGLIGAQGEVFWNVAELGPGGEAVSVTCVARVRTGLVQGSFEAHVEATAAEWQTPATTAPWLTFVGSGVPVSAIQGEGNRSPFVRSDATTEGVVTGVFPEQRGFWIQSLAPDDSPATSEGLYVLTDELDLGMASGDYVRVSGKIREVSGQTLLHVRSIDDIELVPGTFAFPDPVELAPPSDEAEARAYYEALEGMLVAVTDPAVVVGPTTRYGETALVRSDWAIDRVMKGDPKGMVIFLDDGSDVEHVDRSTLPLAAKTGDLVSNVIGPLAYTYEAFKVQPVVTPTLFSEAAVLPALAPAGPDEISIATFNVENLFDIFNPHPSSPERPDLQGYTLRLEKLAATIEAAGAPTVLGLQEVENIAILEDLVALPELVDYDYEPVLIEGFDSRGIDVGYLVRGDRATVESAAQYDAPEGLTSRPPLMITVTVHLDDGDQTVIVINNHFLSMSGGELPTEPLRVAQAEWNAGLVAQIQARDPEALVAVLGDLNSFYDSPPIDALRQAGLRHVYEAVAPEMPYTYIYQGESETLDHILVTPALYERLKRVEVLHTNSDYPPAVPGDASAEHLSDHDPLVVVFGK